MKTLIFVLLSLALSAWHQPVKAVEVSPRSETSFDRDWRFHLGEASGADQLRFDDSSWRELNLPHDWSIEGASPVEPAKRGAMEGPFDKNSPAGAAGAYLDGGVGWYRKTFLLPTSTRAKRVTLLFDGAYMNSHVWINGHDLGVRPNGFVSFFYDLTPYLQFGDEPNVVSVRLEDDQPSCRWYSGAGIYRHVHLITTEPIHIPVWGTCVTTPQAASSGAQVRVRTTILNTGLTPAETELTTIVLDPTGRQVQQRATSRNLAAGGRGDFDQLLALSSARLWSCDHPDLYHVVNEVRVGGRLVDSTTTPFGIRIIEFTKDKGFFLNGEHVPIRGVCDHHDLGCLGAAVYRRALERQLQILRSFGCNALRTSHNPPDPELLDLCDEMGFLVMDEAFDEWKENHKKYGYAESFDQWSDPDLSSMIDRDRNHPSVVLYSIGNEIPEGREGKPQAGVSASRLAGICHREDPTRPVTSACPSPANDWKSGLAQALDVFGINYEVGWYKKNDPACPLEKLPEGDTGYHGQLPLVASETSSQTDTRCEYGLRINSQGTIEVRAKADNQVSSYDYYHPGWGVSGETDLLALKASPWVAGEFIWSGFDYLGEPTPFAWPSRSSYFGVVDLAGFPKDRYYLYKSAWTPQPMVHILPMSWNWPGLEGKPIEVRVFTNAEAVELFLNGKSLGSRNFPADSADLTLSHDNKNGTITYTKTPGLHLAWEVPYSPGVLKAVAMKGGRVVATDTVRTAGAPYQIVLKPDRPQITSGGEDLSFVTVTILDKDGVVCPNADNEVHFALAGRGATIAGLDNGDATNHEWFQGTAHKVFHGLGLIVLKSQDNATGTVELTASSHGLVSATTRVTVTR